MPEKKEKLILLFAEIQKGNTLAFDELFSMYYATLVSFAEYYVKSHQDAEEISSELYIRIWLKRSSLSDIINPEIYLFVSIKNACLNFIRSGRKRNTILQASPAEVAESNNLADHQDPLIDKELSILLDFAVESLPLQRKIIFKLIKHDGLKSNVVASILGISVRTVENQLYQAVKTLAVAISGYLGYNPKQKISRKQMLSDVPLLFFF